MLYTRANTQGFGRHSRYASAYPRSNGGRYTRLAYSEPGTSVSTQEDRPVATLGIADNPVRITYALR